MARYLHTMLRITDVQRSRAFYEALGMEFRRELPIVRNDELEATNYFFGYPGQEEELELTFNHDGRTYDIGTAYGHIAVGVDDLDQVLLITHSWMPELFFLCCRLFLLLHRYGTPFYHHLSLLQLPLFNPSRAMSRSILQLFWSATGSFCAFSTLGPVQWRFDRARTWKGRCAGR